MAMATASSLLALVDSAIEALLTGQHESYSIGARTVTRLDLADLFEQRRILQSEAQRESKGAIRLAKMSRVRQ